MTRSAREQGDMAVATDGTLSLELNASLNAVLTIRVELGVRSTGLLTDDADVSSDAPTAMLESALAKPRPSGPGAGGKTTLQVHAAKNEVRSSPFWWS